MPVLYQDILGDWYVTQDTRNYLGELHFQEKDLPKVIAALQAYELRDRKYKCGCPVKPSDLLKAFCSEHYRVMEEPTPTSGAYEETHE